MPPTPTSPRPFPWLTTLQGLMPLLVLLGLFGGLGLLYTFRVDLLPAVWPWEAGVPFATLSEERSMQGWLTVTLLVYLLVILAPAIRDFNQRLSLILGLGLSLGTLSWARLATGEIFPLLAVITWLVLLHALSHLRWQVNHRYNIRLVASRQGLAVGGLLALLIILGLGWGWFWSLWGLLSAFLIGLLTIQHLQSFVQALRSRVIAYHLLGFLLGAVLPLGLTWGLSSELLSPANGGLVALPEAISSWKVFKAWSLQTVAGAMPWLLFLPVLALAWLKTVLSTRSSYTRSYAQQGSLGALWAPWEQRSLWLGAFGILVSLITCFWARVWLPPVLVWAPLSFALMGQLMTLAEQQTQIIGGRRQKVKTAWALSDWTFLAFVAFALGSSVIWAYGLPADYPNAFWQLPGVATLPLQDLGLISGFIQLPPSLPLWKLWLLPLPIWGLVMGLSLFILDIGQQQKLRHGALCAGMALYSIYAVSVLLPLLAPSQLQLVQQRLERWQPRVFAEQSDPLILDRQDQVLEALKTENPQLLAVPASLYYQLPYPIRQSTYIHDYIGPWQAPNPRWLTWIGYFPWLPGQISLPKAQAWLIVGTYPALLKALPTQTTVSP